MSRLNKLKRLQYQSAHRGCKETDMILGRFAEKYLKDFNDEEVNLYEEFIAQDDWDIYAWVTEKKPLPDDLKNKVTDLLMKFDFSRV